MKAEREAREHRCFDGLILSNFQCKPNDAWGEKMIKLFSKRASKPKVSEMLMNVAGDYLAMGADIEEKQELLNGTASAWNIACLERRERERAIKTYMRKYKKMNPHHSKQDYRDTEGDLKLLIKEKDRLYPDVKVQVATAEVKEIGEKLHVTVMSIKGG